MFEYTRSAYAILEKKFKKYLFITKIILNVSISAYFIYALIAHIGNFVANIILASLFAIYLIFTILSEKKKVAKPVKRKVRIIYQSIRLLIKAFVLGVTLYGMYEATVEVKPLSIVLTTLMIILWVIQLIIEILMDIILPKKDLLIAGFMKDVEPYIEIINKYNNFRGNDTIDINYDKYQKELDKLTPNANALKEEAAIRKENRVKTKKEQRREKIFNTLTFGIFKKK